jgi:hypothetical protein
MYIQVVAMITDAAEQVLADATVVCLSRQETRLALDQARLDEEKDALRDSSGRISSCVNVNVNTMNYFCCNTGSSVRRTKRWLIYFILSIRNRRRF